jgi:hypothetical protein
MFAIALSPSGVRRFNRDFLAATSSSLLALRLRIWVIARCHVRWTCSQVPLALLDRSDMRDSAQGSHSSPLARPMVALVLTRPSPVWILPMLRSGFLFSVLPRRPALHLRRFSLNLMCCCLFLCAGRNRRQEYRQIFFKLILFTLFLVRVRLRSIGVQISVMSGFCATDPSLLWRSAVAFACFVRFRLDLG